MPNKLDDLRAETERLARKSYASVEFQLHLRALQSIADAQSAELLALAGKVAELEGDAARYRWLRHSEGLSISAAAARTTKDFDAAIDAAMTKGAAP